MNKIDLVKLKPDELDENELIQIRGGILGAVIMTTLGSYMLFQIAGNPSASYDAFMRGWNSL
jgi:hypothetical protein